MILNRDQTVLLDHAGWGDDYRRLWRYSIVEDEEEELVIFEGSFSLYEARDGHHVLVVEVVDDEYRATIRSIASIEDVLASALHKGTWAEFSGPEELWRIVPRSVVVDVQDGAYSGPALLKLDANDPGIDPLEWYRDGPYDHLYQGSLRAYPVPESDLVVISIQRDSRPVVYDPKRREVAGHLELANRRGNPSLYFRRNAPELWVDDYDTVLCLRTATWEVLASRRLQGEGNGARQFIGRFWFPYDETVCVVPRPFNGDVALIDPNTLELSDTVSVDGQPLEAVVLDDGRLFARDWQSRRLLRGSVPS